MPNKNPREEDASWGVNNILAAIVLAALVILGGTLLGNSVASKTSGEVAGQTTVKPVVEKTISYEGQDNKTALELLKQSHKVESQDSSVGTFVTGIDDIKNEDNKYWMFYVDDQLAVVGADQLQTKNGQKIEWRFESLQ